MSFKVSFLLLVAAIGVFNNANASSIRPASLFIKQRAEEALQQQILKSRSGISSCHTHYSQILDGLLTTFNAAVQKCEDDQTEEIEQLANESQSNRDETTASLEAVCGGVEVCKDEPTNLGFFDCVNNSGDEQTRAVWKASRDSSETAAQIREKQHAITFKAEKCNSEAERAYIVDTTKATDEMVACYANGGLPAKSAPAIYGEQ